MPKKTRLLYLVGNSFAIGKNNIRGLAYGMFRDSVKFPAGNWRTFAPSHGTLFRIPDRSYKRRKRRAYVEMVKSLRAMHISQFSLSAVKKEQKAQGAVYSFENFRRSSRRTSPLEQPVTITRNSPSQSQATPGAVTYPIGFTYYVDDAPTPIGGTASNVPTQPLQAQTEEFTGQDMTSLQRAIEAMQAARNRRRP